jgi:outer membrane protein insertion porin family
MQINKKHILLIVFLLHTISLFSLSSYSSEVMKQGVTRTRQNHKQIISTVCIKGLKNIKLKTILSVIKSKKNSLYSIDQVKNDVRSIMRLGYFYNVDFDYNSNGELIFIVSERPYIEQVIFNGNKAFSVRKLNKIIKIHKWHHYYTSSIVNDAKKSLHKLYTSTGYHNCKIQCKIVINKIINKATIIFTIRENNKIIVKDIEIIGSLFIDKKTILKQFKTRIGYNFNNKIYIKDLDSLNTFYQHNGFIDYQLIDAILLYNKNKTNVSIKLKIHEGIQYRVGNINFNGNVTINNKKLYEISALHYYDIVNQMKVINNTPQKIYKAYCDIGYINATIKPLLDRYTTKGIVNINYSIIEGERAHIGSIYVYHNNVRKAKILRRAIILKPGEVLVKKKLERSISNLYNLGFINYINYTFLLTAMPNVFDIVFSVIEHRPCMMHLISGYSVLEHIVYGICLHHTNILNLGQKLTLLHQFSARGHNYDIMFEIPYMFNRNLSLIINVFNLRTNIRHLTFKIPNGYNERKNGFLIELGSKLSEYISLFLGYKFEHTKSSSIHRQDLAIVSDTQHTLLRTYVEPFYKTSGIVRLLYDSRDFIYDPSRGNLHSLTIKLANDVLGGDINFIKKIFQSTWYHTMWDKCISSINIEYGSIRAYGHTKLLPFSEQFYLGGIANNIRGYGYSYNMFGKYKFVMNFENTFPILVKHGTDILQGIIFYDVGGIWNRLQDIKFSIGANKYQLHSSIGFGIKVISPLFPIKIYLANGLNKGKYLKLQKLYFDVGRFTF